MHSCSKEFSCGGDGTGAHSIFCRTRVKVALKKNKTNYRAQCRSWTHKTDLEYFKSSDVQDADERGSLSLPAVQGSVDPVDQPSEQTLVRGFGQGLNGKVSLGEAGSHRQVQAITKQGEEETVEEGAEEDFKSTPVPWSEPSGRTLVPL